MEVGQLASEIQIKRDKSELLQEALESEDTSKIEDLWRSVEPEITPADLHLAAKLISKQEVTQAENRQLVLSINTKIDELIEPKVVDREVVVESLKMALESLEQYTYEVQNESVIGAESVRADIYDTVRNILRLDITQLAYVNEKMSNSPAYTANLRGQIDEMGMMIAKGTPRDQLLGYVLAEEAYKDEPMEWYDDEIEASTPEHISIEEATRLAIGFFERDMAQMKKLVTVDKPVMLRALIARRPFVDEPTPIILLAPEIPETEEGQVIDQTRLTHLAIWALWEQERQRHPESDRAKLASFMSYEIGFDHFHHIYFRLDKNEDDEIEIILRKGWEDFVMKSLTSPDTIFRLSRYGIHKVKEKDNSDEVTDVEKFILETEVNMVIDRLADKLVRIVTPFSVKQFRNLAKRYLMDPNPDKSTKTYEIFKDYLDLANKVR